MTPAQQKRYDEENDMWKEVPAPTATDNTLRADQMNVNINELIEQEKATLASDLLTEIDPFHFVEPCEPDCSKERHAYHQGQWDMAVRMEEALNQLRTERGIKK